SVHLNVVSGLTLAETAGDLAIAAAICSSFLEYPIPKGIAFIGEIGLSGELRTHDTAKSSILLPHPHAALEVVIKLWAQLLLKAKAGSEKVVQVYFHMQKTN
ncbi:DNA repair protein RadA, partial [Trifolium medium]|nr:DNA repair protein RadA [Trifolium medium]